MISSHPLPRLLLSAAFVGLTAAALAGCQTVSTEDITGSTGRGGLLNNASAARAPEGLAPQFRGLYAQAPDDPARLRVVIDQIASLTDAAAIELHRRLTAAGARP